MENIQFIASIAERDIDLLVMEELSVNPEFCDWFATRIYASVVYESSLGVWHSVMDGALGESDIVYVFMSQAGERVALLIENKIDAPPQPEQGQRYFLRGEKGVASGDWDDFGTCIIAPQRYLSSARHAQSYNAEISYEEILAFFSSRRFRKPRFLYKARIVQEAIEQNRRGYQPVYSEEMTDFVRHYYALATEKYAHLNMQEAKPRPAGSTWIVFHPQGFPDNISLCHQLSAGLVKAFFHGAAEQIEEIRTRYAPLLDEGASIINANKSVALSAKVTKISPIQNTFAEEENNVLQALRRLDDLQKIVEKAEALPLWLPALPGAQ